MDKHRVLSALEWLFFSGFCGWTVVLVIKLVARILGYD